MAKVVVRPITDPSDGSLIDFLWEERLKYPGWLFEQYFHQNMLAVPGTEGEFLLTITRVSDQKVIAAIPADDPLKVISFDEWSKRDITQLLWQFGLDKTILVEPCK